MEMIIGYQCEDEMAETCKATVTLGNSTVTFEGPSEFVQAQVERFANVRSIGSDAGGLPAEAGRPCQGPEEKQLIAEKRPRGHHEIATVLAFVLRGQGIEEFSEEDIRRAYLRANVRPPKYVSQALRDAKSKFDYIATGSKRGTYKLTNHGDSTVRFDLPRATG